MAKYKTSHGTYYECWCIFKTLYFEMCQLPWLKGKWKKAEEDYSQPGTFYAINIIMNESD